MPNTPPTLVAGGNIYPQRFVKPSTSADDTGLQCGANEEPIGISQEGSNYPPLSDLSVSGYCASAGQTFRLHGLGDVCEIVAGDVVRRGKKLKSDSVGRGVEIDESGTTLQNYGALALQSAAAAGEKIRVQVIIGSVYPALS